MKERLDVLLVKRGLAESREKAKGAIMAGTVFVDGRRIDKPGAPAWGTDAEIEIKGESLPFVSRGGKLEAGQGLGSLSCQGRGKDSSRYWRINRRLHRLPAAERRG